MSHSAPSIQNFTRPPTIDTIHLRNIQLHLPAAPEAWHRKRTPQPCTSSLRLSYSSSISAAEADDVARTIDYGKLFRRINRNIQDLGEVDKAYGYTLGNHIVSADGHPMQRMLLEAMDQDVRLFGAIIVRCCLEIFDECAVRTFSPPVPCHCVSSSMLNFVIAMTQEACPHSLAIRPDFGEFEIRLHFPKAILRADGGLWY